MTALPLALALLLSPVAAPPPGLASPGASGTAVAVAAPSYAGPASDARAVPPLAELRVLAAFDPPSQAYGVGHRGVDLAGVAGQVVVSPLPGTVTTAGSIAGTPVVVVDHGEVRTTYQPVRAGVRVGSLVGAGTPIGLLEAAGSHCAPTACLHWGLKRGEEYLDPMSLLGPRRVRLLPLDGGAGTTTGGPTTG